MKRERVCESQRKRDGNGLAAISLEATVGEGRAYVVVLKEIHRALFSRQAEGGERMGNVDRTISVAVGTLSLVRKTVHNKVLFLFQLLNPSAGGGSSGVEGPLKILKSVEGSRRRRRGVGSSSSPTSSSDDSFSYKSLRRGRWWQSFHAL